jgi:ParB family chromosome partitioning protein
MRLLALSSDERTALANGRISEGHARSLMGIQNPKEREGALLRLLSTGGTVRDVEQQARKSRVQAPPKPSATLPPRKDPHLSEVENRLRTVLGTKVEIDKGPQGRGILTIEFYDDEDLNRILETLGFNP